MCRDFDVETTADALHHWRKSCYGLQTQMLANFALSKIFRINITFGNNCVNIQRTI